MNDPESNNKIKVNAYSGFKVNERPTSFYISDSKKVVRNIINRWIDPDKDYFKVLTDDNWIYILSWSREEDVWAVEKVSKIDDVIKDKL